MEVSEKMDRDQLFIRTIKDLESRLDSNDEYEILMIASLLRKLLLDRNPLTDQVNRKRRLKIKYRINDRPLPTDEPVPIFWSVEDGFDPDTSVPHLSKPIEVTKDQLLSRPVLISNGQTVTVRELILHLAHVQGAVHSGMPKDKKDKVMKKLIETLGIGGLPAGLRLLRAIGRVVRKSLQPLKLKIQEEIEL